MGGSTTDYGSSGDYNFSRGPSVTKRTAKDYADIDGRNYVAPTKGLPPINGKDIGTDSKLAAAIILDVTGSMMEIPKMFIEKMPTLYAEANAAIQGINLKELEKGKKLDDLLKMAIVAVGDAGMDKYPFQVLDYCNGANLVNGVLGIFPEGGGGGNLEESYDLGAYYLLNHSDTPNVPKGAKPLLIIAGDEGFYKYVKAPWVKKHIGDDLNGNLETKEVMKKVAKKFDTYILRPEISYDAGIYATIQKQWEEVFGPQRVLRMKDYSRLVDCIIGICGYASDNFKISEELLRRRQTTDQVDEVLRVLHPLAAKSKGSGKK